MTSSSRAGFTLVEVLVSSFLALIIMGMLFGVLMGTIDAWEGGSARLKSSGDARLALDILKTDLESMVVRQTQYNQEWMVSLPSTENGITSTRLVFFAPSLDRDTTDPGDIVSLSYRVVFQDPISPASPVVEIFGLYKSMTTTTEAFNNVLGLPSLYDAYWNAGISDPSPTDNIGFLAPNVVGFDIAWWVRYTASGTEKYKRFDSSYTFSLRNELSIYKDNTLVLQGGKIEAVDISLTTISDEGMRRYTFLADGGTASPDDLADIVSDTGQSHTLRIPIHY
ncbi:prepilin-type N-terminal cleavage/methylation domain-containing protein [Kiritimatiellota bacterium B12222]|nr:prepilin-type N-terminal cleavage/methylation domain-containing protein [Kiritimatiellota bacterium B12222]